MKRLRRLQILAAGFLLFQVAIGYAGWFTPRHEVFPFTSWLLFSLVPDRITDYDLLLHGSPLYPQNPPRPFNQSGALVRAPHSIVSYQLIQQLGDAVEKGDAPRAEALRQEIEEQFAAAPMTYDLVRLTYRPAARWSSGQLVSPARIVRSFTASQLRPPPAEPGTDASETPLPARR